MSASEAMALVQTGGVLSFAVAVFVLLRAHLARVEQLIADNAIAHTRVAVAIEALSAQVREVRDDVTPVDGPAGRYHIGRMPKVPR